MFSSISQSLSIRLLSVFFTLALAICPSANVEARTSAGLEHFVKHFVAVKFKETTTPEQIDKVLVAFKGMKKDIPQIVSMEYGPDISVEHKNKGFTHGFLLRFGDEEARNVYLVHHAHLKFLAMAKPLIEDIFVLDFVDSTGSEK